MLNHIYKSERLTLTSEKPIFFIASHVYDNYLSQLLSEKQDQSTYSELLTLAYNDCYGWSDFWVTYLEQAGFEVVQVIASSKLLQQKWAKEKGFEYSSDNWGQEILMEQVQFYRPTVFFAHDFYTADVKFRSLMKSKVDSVRLVLAWDGIDRRSKLDYAGCDIVLSCLKETADYYSSLEGSSGYYFKFGFDPRILEKMGSIEKVNRLTFVGSLYLFDKGHHFRKEVLSHLMDEVPLNLHLGNQHGMNPYFTRDQLKRISDFQWREYWNVMRFRHKTLPPVFGLDMYRTLASSTVTFNAHIDLAGESAANIRLIEGTGVGSCVLTDFKSNITDFFNPDEEIITYRSIDECVDKAKYLLEHPEEARLIGEKAQQRVLSDHHLGTRVRDLAEFVLTKMN